MCVRARHSNRAQIQIEYEERERERESDEVNRKRVETGLVQRTFLQTCNLRRNLNVLFHGNCQDRCVVGEQDRRGVSRASASMVGCCRGRNAGVDQWAWACRWRRRTKEQKVAMELTAATENYTNQPTTHLIPKYFTF